MIPVATWILYVTFLFESGLNLFSAPVMQTQHDIRFFPSQVPSNQISFKWKAGLGGLVGLPFCFKRHLLESVGCPSIKLGFRNQLKLDLYIGPHHPQATLCVPVVCLLHEIGLYLDTPTPTQDFLIERTMFLMFNQLYLSPSSSSSTFSLSCSFALPYMRSPIQSRKS